jgi:hypothetical protein
VNTTVVAAGGTYTFGCHTHDSPTYGTLLVE